MGRLRRLRLDANPRILWMGAVAMGHILLVAVSCTPRPSAANPESSLDGAPSAAGTVEETGALTRAPDADSPAREGEVCATYSPTLQPDPTFQRPCVPGLVCCVPPHGAVMQIVWARCRAPCKPTPPSEKPQMAGCSSNGCPWALVP
jgi:hypothetical protein